MDNGESSYRRFLAGDIEGLHEMLSMLLLACPAQMTAFAEDEQFTPGYIPEGLPVAVNTIEYVDAETQAVLFAMRDQLRENVYVTINEQIEKMHKKRRQQL